MRNAAEREKRSIAAVLDAVVLGVRAVQFAVQVLAAAFRAFFVGNLSDVRLGFCNEIYGKKIAQRAEFS